MAFLRRRGLERVGGRHLAKGWDWSAVWRVGPKNAVWAGLEMSGMAEVCRLIRGWSLKCSGVESWRVRPPGWA